MIAQNNGGSPPYLKFEMLSRVPGLVHGVFTRHGGVSLPPYASLNVGWSNGDSPEAVRENLSRMKGALGLDRVVSSCQVHGDVIHVLDDAVLSRAESHPPLLVAPPGDALVTGLSGVGLLIKIADCQSVFLVDPTKRVIANIHSGWKGSVRGIVPKTVRVLADRFGSNPADILAAISPSLGPCCGEFRNFRDELPESFLPFQVSPLHFDFWAITRRQLLDSGLEDGHIQAAGLCTVCGTKDFFSYRGERSSGRMATVIAWEKERED